MKILKMMPVILAVVVLASCAGPEGGAADIPFPGGTQAAAVKEAEVKPPAGRKAEPEEKEQTAMPQERNGSLLEQPAIGSCKAVDKKTADTQGCGEQKVPESSADTAVLKNKNDTREPATWASADKEPESRTEKKTGEPSGHKHEFRSKMTKQATCSEKGILTWYCSCGVSYPEDITATGLHEWEDVYETVHHDAVIESVWVTDKAAWNEPVVKKEPVYEEHLVVVATCRGCGMQFTGATQYEAIQNCHRHIVDEHANQCGYGTEDSYYEQVQTGCKEVTDNVYHPEEGHYEERVIQNGYDEKKVTGRRCIFCGCTE